MQLKKPCRSHSPATRPQHVLPRNANERRAKTFRTIDIAVVISRTALTGRSHRAALRTAGLSPRTVLWRPTLRTLHLSTAMSFDARGICFARQRAPSPNPISYYGRTAHRLGLMNEYSSDHAPRVLCDEPRRERRASKPKQPTAGDDTRTRRVELCTSYLNDVRRTVFRVLPPGSSAADRADVEQTVMLKLLCALAGGGVRANGNLRGYVTTIARNAARDVRRKRVWEVLVADCPEMPSTEAEDIDGELQLLARYVTELSPDLAAVFRARFILNLSQERAAVSLTISRQNVRTLESELKRRALAFLRDSERSCG